MEFTDFELLKSADAQAIIEANLDADPAKLALRKGVPAAVATQLKYLQRARTKLPRFYAARCILPPRAFEQASSEQTAQCKRVSGNLCIDLTCGLGVDTIHFARHFERVIAVERDPLLAEVARHNFDRLELRNVEVVNASAEEFLQDPPPKIDLIYLDPDRRSESNKKLVLLEECTPDVVVLRERLLALSPCVMIKASPLFDPVEAFRIFGAHTKAEAVSLNGECKEIVIEIGPHLPHPTLAATAIGGGSVEWPLNAPPIGDIHSFSPPYKYLLVPDVALRKMRMAKQYFAARGCFIASDNGYAFADRLPEGGLFRACEIEAIHPYKPKKIKRSGFIQLQIMRRDFPLTNAQIADQLGIREGGTQTAAFTQVEGEKYMITFAR